MPHPVSSLINSTAELEKNTQAVSSLNVSDPNVTIFFSVMPNVNVSLALKLFHGTPGNGTYFNGTTIFSQTGNSSTAPYPNP